MKDGETKEVFVIWQNTDLTEGRGYPVPIKVCEIKTTALRLAKGQGVQGTDADVRPATAHWYCGAWHAPVQIVPPTATDEAQQKIDDARRVVLEKARAAGLSDADIALLAKGGAA